MKQFNITSVLILFLIIFHLPSNGKVLFDQKYVTVGVLSNESLPQFTYNQNIRFLGVAPAEELIKNGGQLTLDKLFNLNNPNIEALWSRGYNESTQEEYEIATKDISADPRTILQSEGAVQLMKNNYIVIFTDITKVKDGKIVKTGKKLWKVYHVDIDDEIINQVYNNWNSPSTLSEIKVPITLVANGKIKEKKISSIIFNISKKVGAFAIRGPIISSHPTLASITDIQGVKKGDKVKVYQTYENNKGEQYSKKIADTRVLFANKSESKLSVISGRYPSYKKGDIACLVGRGDWSISLNGEYSFGNDWRAGGDLEIARRFYYTNKGFAWYANLGVQINQFNKEPLNVWHSEESFSSPSIQPSLRTYGGYVGISMGYSFLTKFEILPFVNAGLATSVMSRRGCIWNSDDQKFEWHNRTGGLTLKGGLNVAFNIWYPFQLLVGANYNYYFLHENILTKRHDFNRLNLSAGFKYNF